MSGEYGSRWSQAALQNMATESHSSFHNIASLQSANTAESQTGYPLPFAALLFLLGLGALGLILTVCPTLDFISTRPGY